ncbi:hypothetical protein FB157_10422 [Streptomyces sp. BK340]|nr:hypothetical protein FB157_10422 [Streptomyces sp. BK340]
MLNQRRASRLAAVCTREAEIRNRLCGRTAGDSVELEEVLAAARNGGDLAAALDKLHGALRTALNDARGLDAYAGDAGTGGRGLFAAGVDRRVPAEPILLCPRQLCQRHEWPGDPASAPLCAVTGDPLLHSEG